MILSRYTRALLPGILLGTLLLLLTVLPVPVLAGTPVVTVNDLPAQVLLGEDFTFTVTFDNVGTNGFGPFIDVIFPVTGADANDGIDFVQAVYGTTTWTIDGINAVSRTFDAAGCANHPFARSLGGAPMQVCGTPGDRLVSIRLPFGSYTASQPPIEVEITARTSGSADVGTALAIRARGGFQFGDDALNNPCCDPSTVGPASPNSATYPGGTVVPVMLRVAKSVAGDEEETATGGNFTRRYIVTGDVPNGRTVNNLVVSDTLAPELVFGSIVSVSPGTCTPSFAAPTLTVNCPSVTGGAGSDDVRVEFSVSVAQGVVNGISGDAVNVSNTATISGDAVLTDPGDGASVFMTGGAAAPVIAARSIALQKSVVVAVDADGSGAPSPGDTLQYTLSFQVSDYFAFSGAVVNDIMTDGQQWDGSAPLFALTQHGATTPAAAMNAANFAFTPNVPAPGQTQAVFDVSDELVTRAFVAGGLLYGGCVRELTPIPTPDCAVFNAGATQGTITYRALLLDNYNTLPPSGDASVDQGDTLGNAATMNATVQRADGSGLPGGGEDDGDSRPVNLPRGLLNKEIVQIDRPGVGVLLPPINVEPGDRVTFRLSYLLPTSDVENLVVTDFLPIPAFNAALFSTTPAAPGTIPPAERWAVGAGSTFAGAYPTPAVSAADNAIVWTFGDFDSPANTPSTIEMLVTMTVQGTNFAPSLNLANMLRVDESSSQLNAAQFDDFVATGFNTPALVTRKGVVAATGGTLVPPTAAPVTFNPPGTGGAPFGGTLNSTGLGSTDIASGLGSAQPGALIRFAIVVENVGTSGAFDITVRDVIPAGFTIPTGGINLTIVRGDGTPLTFTAVNPGDPIPLFGGGITLNDPPGEAACQPAHPTNGSNIAVITYDLAVDPSLTPPIVLTNTSQVTGTARAEGGANLLAGADLTAYTNRSAVGVGTGVGGALLVTDPLITKRGSPLFALPGEEVLWTIDIQNTGGIPMANIRLVDTVQPYLELLSATATMGTVTPAPDGSEVVLTLAALQPGERVTLTIRTRVRGEPLPPPWGAQGLHAMCTPGGPLLVENIACMNYSGGAQVCAQANVICTVTSLPATGETPWWNLPALLLALGVSTGMGVWVFKRLRR